MPCKDFPSPEEERADAMIRKNQLEKEAEIIKAKIDKLTRMLCEVLGTIDTEAYDFTKEIKDWWKEHKKKDEKKRVAKTISEALAKLTPSEIETIKKYGITSYDKDS